MNNTESEKQNMGQAMPSEKQISSPSTPSEDGDEAGGAKKQVKKKKTISANITNCKYDVVAECVANAGMKMTLDAHNYTLFWIDTGVSVERLLDM